MEEQSLPKPEKRLLIESTYLLVSVNIPSKQFSDFIIAFHIALFPGQFEAPPHQVITNFENVFGVELRVQANRGEELYDFLEAYCQKNGLTLFGSCLIAATQ
jgi:hypothetical protein